MNFIGNLFKTTSKDTNGDAILKENARFFSPQKAPCNTRSQNYSEDKNWPEISMDTKLLVQKLIEVKLGKTDIIPKSRHQNSHMVYQICVLTSDFQYSIKKRFSVFHKFFNETKKEISHLNLPFPKKTLLVSGTNIQVVTQRYQILNSTLCIQSVDFIKRVFTEVKQQQNQNLIFKFINFIEIDQECNKRKFKTYTQVPKINHQINTTFSVDQTSIIFELKKLNDYSTHQIDILSRLENYISYKNHKLTNDEIKTLLIGNAATNLKGILNLSLSINNQIKSLELLKFLIDYLSPQKKSYNDKIYKQFEKLPLESFNFNFDHIKNNFNIIEFKKMFFILLELYCHNKFFNQTKMIQKYPQLLSEFLLWKNLADINHGNTLKKTGSASTKQFGILLRGTSIPTQKAKSFEIHPKNCETRPQTQFAFTTGANNFDTFPHKITQSQEKNKHSFKSNDSTSELTIQEDWENCKMKLQLGNSFNEIINQDGLQSMENINSSELYCFKSNKCNKIKIEIFKTLKPMGQCEQISKYWNKLIYDERHDQFTGIDRIYMKLNGKSKIFKFRGQDEKVEKKDENTIRIFKRRFASYNSISKSGKQNIEECFKFKLSNNSNGFQQITTIENMETINELQGPVGEFYRKVTIELNFEGEQDFFRTEIMGQTTHILTNAIQAYLVESI